MDTLKSLVPPDLKRIICNSTVDNLLSSSSSLLQLFTNLQQFHQITRELADSNSKLCGKNKGTALSFKLKGNQSYLTGDFRDALTSYSQALRFAPVDAEDAGRSLVATLFLNRANVLYKLNLLVESLRDSNRALQLYPNYAKAWYRRGKVNSSMGNHDDAFHDFTISKNLESSSSGKKQLESELKMIPDRRDAQNSRHSQCMVNSSSSLDCLSILSEQIKLRCVSTVDKGRGMVTECDIPQASLVHVEEPHSMIISKKYRDTHCHFCLNDLPANAVSCLSCATAFYCSELCQIQAGGRVFRDGEEQPCVPKIFSDDLQEYFMCITSGHISLPETELIQEHEHECRGVNWPAVLPSDVVLAGRVVVKLIKQKKVSLDLSNLMQSMDLAHSYSKMDPESKLELHIYSVVLLSCLSNSSCAGLSICGVSVSQTVVLLSSIKVNSMAVFRMSSIGVRHRPNPFENAEDDQIQGIEQIRVGQALYTNGSLFNHSCKPNVHVYFLSRRLLIRTTEFVPAGSSLELSYGPEIGKWNCGDRLKLLEEEYFFQCRCRGCSKMNTSDLVINAYRCEDPKCSGVVLDSGVTYREEQKLKHHLANPHCRGLDDEWQMESAAISEVACNLLDKAKSSLHIEHSHCLKCGLSSDLKSSRGEVKKAMRSIRRLEELTVSEGNIISLLSDSIKSLNVLKSFLHKYNKNIAEAEDVIARASCFTGDLQVARRHCKASISILEKLYDDNHIVIGYELVKLASIQLSLGDSGAGVSISRLHHIFRKYYGSHAELIFPHLWYLGEQASKFLT